MESACPMTWAKRTVESFMNISMRSPSNCLLPFHTMGSRYIVMQESWELKTRESQTACTSLRKARTLLKACTLRYTESVLMLKV